MSKMKTVDVADLKVNLFVRKEIDVEHALIMSLLMAEDVVFPPIKITEDNIVIDGRHRIEAYELNKITTVKCEVVEVENETDLIAQAYRANTGGSKPPTLADTEHTISILLERGESMVNIAKLLGLPTNMTRRYAQEVKSRMSRAKLVRAATAVTDGGLTIAKAAEKEGVDLDKLKEMLSGRRNKQKWGMPQVKRELTKLYRSIGSKNASTMRRLLDKYQDGDVTEKQVREVFSQLKALQKRSARSITDWEKRFEAGNGKASAA